MTDIGQGLMLVGRAEKMTYSYFILSLISAVTFAQESGHYLTPRALWFRALQGIGFSEHETTPYFDT